MIAPPGGVTRERLDELTRQAEPGALDGAEVREAVAAQVRGFNCDCDDDEAVVSAILAALAPHFAAAQRAVFRAAVEAAARAAMRVQFGPPSGWGGDRPAGWHLDRACSPLEAANHDNGARDAFMAIRALPVPDAFAAPEPSGSEGLA